MLEVGQVIGGDFRVVRPLGQGGMGELFVVEQLSTGRQRALKVMHQRLIRDEGLRERFVREARVGSLVDSAHIAEVVAAGVEEASGLPWLAMELLEGVDLHEYLERHGPCDIATTVAFVRQIAHALAAAHAGGVVHRDLKPRNVFVARERRAGDGEVIKVLDFGIAKLLAHASHTGSDTLGSPGWMAPEQSDPEATIGPPVDVWALGLLVFFMLTGKPFWMASNDASGSLEMLLREVILNPIPLAHERAAELGVKLDEKLAPWFERCVCRDSAQRFSDAEKAAAALERLVRQGGVADPVAEAEQDGASHQDVAPDSATDVPVVSPSADGSTRALGGGREATGDRRNVATVVALMLVGTVAVVWARFDDAAPAKTPSAAASQVLRPRELTAPETPQPLPRVVPSNSAETEPPSSAESTRPPPVVVPKPAVPMANWRAAAMAVALPLARRAGRVCGRDYRAAGAAYSVAPDGSIHNLVIMPPGSLLPNAARACIEQVMRAVTFPAPGVNESLTVVINPIP